MFDINKLIGYHTFKFRKNGEIMKTDAKKNRNKFILTIICLILIILAMGFGVYAVVSGRTDIQGTVTYYANSVAAGVYGHIEGYEMGNAPIEDFSANFSPSTPQGSSYSWDIGHIDFSRDVNDWQNKVDIFGLPIYGQDKQPTITIRVAIFNYAVHDANNLDRGRIYIGNIEEPLANSNLQYTYRMGYGTIASDTLNWKSSFEELGTLETFNVQDREYTSAEDCYLNDSENGMYLSARTAENMAMNVYLLDFKIRVIDSSVTVHEFQTSLSIKLSSSPFAGE